MELGGFRSGFHTQVVQREEARFKDYLICNHNCSQIIQLVSHVSNEVEFELCTIEAEKMAHVLLHAVSNANQSNENKGRKENAF